MAKTELQGDREIAAFSSALTKVLGHEEWPPSVAGDLSDLLGTLERGVEFLTNLTQTPPREEIPALLLGVELLLKDDLALIAKDLLPPLRFICKEAYFVLGDEDALVDDEPTSL